MKSMLAAGLLISLGVPLIGAGDDPSSRLSLRGVKAFDVLVEDIPNAPPGLRRGDFQTDVELRCRQAGIRVGGSPGAYLYIDVNLQELFYANGRSEGVYAVSIGVEFNQPVLLERDPNIRLMAPTWSRRGVGTVDLRDLRTFCRESVRDKVDKFLNAFLEQNPR
jgi:hypothetical protein